MVHVNVDRIFLKDCLKENTSGEASTVINKLITKIECAG
jgi:hypothetical protein